MAPRALAQITNQPVFRNILVDCDGVWRTPKIIRLFWSQADHSEHSSIFWLQMQSHTVRPVRHAKHVYRAPVYPKNEKNLRAYKTKSDKARQSRQSCFLGLDPDRAAAEDPGHGLLYYSSTAGKHGRTCPSTWSRKGPQRQRKNLN